MKRESSLASVQQPCSASDFPALRRHSSTAAVIAVEAITAVGIAERFIVLDGSGAIFAHFLK